MKSPNKILTTAGLATVFWLVCSAGATAATYTVTKLVDTADGTCDADCSLREAIIAANGGPADTIVFSALFNTAQTINLTLVQGDLQITDPDGLTIIGPGTRLLTVNQAIDNTRVFNVSAAGFATILDITISGGNKDGSGGGVINQGTLTLTRVRVTHNVSKGGSGGGGVFNGGGGLPDPALLTIRDSLIDENATTGDNHHGGGIYNSGAGNTVTIANTTITNNTTGAGLTATNTSGGGIVNSGTVNLNNVTISHNQAVDSAGGVWDNGTINVRNTIIANNNSGTTFNEDVKGSFTSNGNNLIGIGDDSTGFTNGVNGDLVGSFGTAPVNPLLGPLQNNFGPTNTRAIPLESPAYNAGNNCVITSTCVNNPSTALTFDQRGPGFTRQSAGTVDIGAFELQVCIATATGNWSSPATWGCGHVPTVTDTVAIANGRIVTLNTVPTSAGIFVNSGGTLTITTNQSLSSNLTVAGTLALSGGILSEGGNTLAVTNCSTSAVTGGDSTSYVNDKLLRCVAAGGPYDFPVGTANGYSPIQLSNVGGAGNFTVLAVQGPQPNMLTPAVTLQRYWTLTGTGVTADLTFHYLAADVTGTESNYKIFKYNGSFTQFTPNVLNTTLHLATLNNVSSFSDWTMGEPAPLLRIDSVTPAAGRTSGNQPIRLTGAFDGLSTLTMGGVSTPWFYTNGGGDTSTITVTTPAHSVGAVQIDLTPTSGSPYSKANAFAYLPTVFTDDTLSVGVTTVMAQHIIELRHAVDTLRAVAGLGPAPWTDATLTQFTSFITAIHIQELRSYLDDAATRLGYSTSPYTDPTLGTGDSIKRIHIEELRQRIRVIAG